MNVVQLLNRPSPYRRHAALLVVLVLSTCMSLGTMAVKWAMAGRLYYRFLAWDLFLAWIPFWVSAAVYVLHLRGERRLWVFLLLGSGWLLFFPNAPYLLTEFGHLGRVHDGAWWCDLVLMISVACNGLILGLLSLYMIQCVLRERAGRRAGWWTAAVCIGLCSAGVSLGRFGRFNSWDVLLRPASVAAGLLTPLLHPRHYYYVLAVSALLCGFLMLAYMAMWTLILINEDNRLAAPGRGAAGRTFTERPESGQGCGMRSASATDL